MSVYRVLVVEDELLVAADIEESLEILGYNVVGSVATGKDAIEMVNKYLPDIILMDIMLKGDMTGIEAATLIKQKHDVPIVYLTANADLATIEKAKFSLPYGYIIKPFNEKDLQTNIELARFKFTNDIKSKMESDQFNTFYTSEKDAANKTIIVEAEKGLEKIQLEDVYYIQGDQTTSTIFLIDDELTVNKGLAEIEKTLPNEQFIRVNQDCILNVDKIFLSKFPEVIIVDRMNVLTVDADKKELLALKTKTV
jgi:DNA-binding LytR/AlgR family response regulator